MGLSEVKSTAELSIFIESYWSFNKTDHGNLIFFPDGTFNLFFTVEEFYVHNEGRSYKPGIYLIPITKKPISISTNRAIHGIRFKAFSLLNVLNTKLNGLGLVNNLEDIRSSNLLLKNYETLFDLKADKCEIINRLELIAFELLSEKYNVNTHLRDKVNYILDNKGAIRISEMANEFGLSRQALHKSFKQHLLISPKDLSAIWQLNHFFTLAENDDSLTGVALDAGYYDQSHFINKFKTEFGMSPLKYINSNARTFTFAKESMSKRFNNYYDPEH
jgi:AraC-like DNA-binding protein